MTLARNILMLLSVSAIVLAAPHSASSRTDQERTNRELSKYINFDSAPGDFGEPPHVSQFKAWTTSEISTVTADLYKAFDRAPGLFVKIACDGPLKLRRTNTLFITEDEILSATKPQDGLACNVSGELVISDKFFRARNRDHILAHELTHAADFGLHVSTSKEWTSFAAPAIREVNNRLKSNSTSVKQLESQIRQEKLWPSVYGGANYSEALAEYISSYVVDRDFPIDKRIIKSISPKLLKPSKEELQWAISFRRADAAFRGGDYKSAINQLEQLSKLDSDAPLPFQYLAYCYLHENRVDDALRAAEDSERCYQSAGIDLNDSRHRNLERLRANLLIANARFTDARELLLGLKKLRPDDAQIETQLRVCDERINAQKSSDTRD